MGKRTGQYSEPEGLAQLLGYKAYLSEVISCTVELCPSKPGKAWTRSGGKSVSLVFCWMVRTCRVAGNGTSDLPVQDGRFEHQ
jgi:hypothetical protein